MSNYDFSKYICAITHLPCCGCSLFCEHRQSPQQNGMDTYSDIIRERIRELIIQACDSIKENVDDYITCCDPSPSLGIEITINIPQKYIVNNKVDIEKFKFTPVKVPHHKNELR